MRAILGTARYWVPLVAGMVCIVVATFVGAILGWILIMASFGLILDGATAMWAKAGGTGSMKTYRQ